MKSLLKWTMKWTLLALLGGLLLSGSWAANSALAQEKELTTGPVTAQSRAVADENGPVTVQGGATVVGGEASPDGMPTPPPGAVIIRRSGSAAGPNVTIHGAAPLPPPGMPGPGMELPPGGERRIYSFRRGEGPMPNLTAAPAEMRMRVPDGGPFWISRATLPGKAVKAAFLGVITTPASATLRSQLNLKAGLVVDMVEPKSSAETAGLETHDIIEKCDDQWLINPAQFIGLIRIYKPGESVTLTVLRHGQRKKITAKLEEREMYDVADDDGNMFYQQQGMARPDNPEGHFSLFTKPTEGFGPVQTITARAIGAAPLMPGFVATFGDDKQQLLITIRDGHQILTAKDPSGKQIFQGPIDTPQERKAVPQEVRKKLEEMEKIRVKIRTPDFSEPESGPEAMPRP